MTRGTRALDVVPNIAWEGDHDGTLLVIDQTRLPAHLERRRIEGVGQLCTAIRQLVVRGAPAIGVVAAYGAVLACRETGGFDGIHQALAALRATRPTAVNLFAALDRIETVLRPMERAAAPMTEVAARLLEEARAIHQEDARLCEAMGGHGAGLIQDGMRLLTHCHTGRLATGGIGTALAAIRTAAAAGRSLHVWVNETRPLLQGARLTAFELVEAGIPFTLLSDTAGPGLMSRGDVDAVFVGADRIAANGDVANKVGTLPLALAAARFAVPFYVVAPTTTLDAHLAQGATIPIEERSPAEILVRLEGCAPPGVRARNPAFDVTPADLVTALVTEHGVLERPDRAGIKALLSRSR